MSEEEYKKAFSKNLRAYTEANGKTQADIVKDLGCCKQEQKYDPLTGKSIQDAPTDTHCNGTGKKDLFHAFIIRNRSTHRTQQRNHDRDHCNRHRVISRCPIRCQLPRLCPYRHRLKPDRYQRTRQHRIRRITHIIKHPGELFVVQIAEYSSLLHTASSIPIYIF